MTKSRDVDESVKAIQVDRAAFEDAVRKLLHTPPTSKEKISRKIKSVGYRPLKPVPKPR